MPAEFPDRLPMRVEMPGYQARGNHDWGEMSAICETVSGPAVGMDIAPLFAGLPEDRCQASHYGYLLEGRVEYRFADHTETVEAGQVYYIPPATSLTGSRQVDPSSSPGPTS